jgi:hypothetical protein
MIYAIRSVSRTRETLVEYSSEKWLNLAKVSGFVVRQVDSATARKWVLDGKEHETGLFVDDDGKLRHAPPQSEPDSPPDRSAPSIGSTPRIDRTSDGARK